MSKKNVNKGNKVSSTATPVIPNVAVETSTVVSETLPDGSQPTTAAVPAQTHESASMSTENPVVATVEATPEATVTATVEAPRAKRVYKTGAERARNDISKKSFCLAYIECKSFQELADKVKMTPTQAMSRANYYKSKGVVLPSYRAATRDKIDNTELNKLIAAAIEMRITAAASEASS